MKICHWEFTKGYINGPKNGSKLYSSLILHLGTVLATKNYFELRVRLSQNYSQFVLKWITIILNTAHLSLVLPKRAKISINAAICAYEVAGIC